MPCLIGTYHNGDCLAVVANQEILAIRTMLSRELASPFEFSVTTDAVASLNADLRITR